MSTNRRPVFWHVVVVVQTSMLSRWPTDPGISWTKLGLFGKLFSSLCCVGRTGYHSCFLNLLPNIVKYFVETTDSLRKPNILLAKIKDLLLWVYSFCSFPNKALVALLLAIYHRRPSSSPSRSLDPCPSSTLRQQSVRCNCSCQTIHLAQRDKKLSPNHLDQSSG